MKSSTSFYKHPLEMLVNSIIGSLLVYALLGIDPAGGAVLNSLYCYRRVLHHKNVRTPRWIGFFFQRPEMHRIHHQYMRHKNNYGDIKWWEHAVGDLRKSGELYQRRAAFDDKKEQRLLSMLRFVDVHPNQEAWPFLECDSLGSARSPSLTMSIVGNRWQMTPPLFWIVKEPAGQVVASLADYSRIPGSHHTVYRCLEGNWYLVRIGEFRE